MCVWTHLSVTEYASFPPSSPTSLFCSEVIPTFFFSSLSTFTSSPPSPPIKWWKRRPSSEWEREPCILPSHRSFCEHKIHIPPQFLIFTLILILTFATVSPSFPTLSSIPSEHSGSRCKSGDKEIYSPMMMSATSPLNIRPFPLSGSLGYPFQGE